MHDLARDEDDDKDGDKDGDDASIEDLLDHTRTILLESADARCLFITTLRGLDVCMLYLSQAYHRKAAAVLKAAGLPLAATGNADVGRRERMDGINVNSQSSARWRFLWCTASALQPAHPPPPKNKQADDDNATATVDHPPLCEWPESLLLRIAERALDSLRTADAMTTTYFDLLRHASGDIMLRCGVLAKAATTGATSDRMRIPCRLKLSIMERVLQAICKHVVMIKAQCAHARKHQQLQCCCLCFLLLRRRLFFFFSSLGTVVYRARALNRRILYHLQKEIVSSGDSTRAFPLPVAQCIAEMLGNFAQDALSRRALAALDATPISTVLHLYKSAQLLGKVARAHLHSEKG